MKRFYVFLALVTMMVAARVPARADTVIDFANSGGPGITFNPASSGGGQNITFSHLQVTGGSVGGNYLDSDSSQGAIMTISPGSGSFHLNRVSSDGLTGYFASNSSANISIGNSSSGILTGSLNMIEITTNSRLGSAQSFTLQLTITNMNFASCTKVGCTNSTLLQTFSQVGNGGNSSNVLNFSFAASKAGNAAGLLGMTGSNPSAASGTLDSIFDTVTPEPASLALFGSCLLMAGMKLHRRVAKS